MTRDEILGIRRPQTMNEKLRMIVIDGIMEIDKHISNKEFTEKFIKWVESNGWYFGGAVKDYRGDDDERD